MNFQLSVRQLRVLLWKAWLIRKRHYIITLFEIFFPFLLFYFILKDINSFFFLNQTLPENNKNVLLEVNLLECYPNDIIYAPSSNFTDTIMSYVKQSLCYPTLLAFKTTQEAIDYRKNHNDSSSFDLILFNQNDEKLSYSISTFSSQFLQFETLQYHINHAFMSAQNMYSNKVINEEKWKINSIFISNPSTQLTNKVWFMLSVLFQLINLQLLQLTIKQVMEEKQSGATELLELMGMSKLIYWVSHFLENFFVLLFHGVLVTVLATTSLMIDPLIVYTSSFLFLTTYISFGVITIFFAFLITIFFNKTLMACIFGFLIWLLAISFSYFTDSKSSLITDQSLSWKLSWRDFLPTNCIFWAVKLIGEFETLHIKNDIFKLGPTLNINFAIIFAIIFIVCLVYSLLIYYLQAVWPFQTTPTNPWNFIFKKSFWMSQKEKNANVFSLNQVKNKYFEQLPEGSEVGAKTISISKSFGFKENKKQAVQNVSLDFVKGQIHVLLGHNGAGKTTLMSMITGLLSPTSGTAQIAGYDIQTQREFAQLNMSICPQKNLLFEDLNVEEHLQIFAVLKGLTFQKARKNAEDILKLIDLENKKKVLSKKLSGGMKRKLQLAMALVCETQIIVLDEPTSGLDPQARRIIWDALLQFKHEKTIILTTHIMEEADAIGDRISIMSNGRLCCVGSSIFLKKLYGTGYILHLSINDNFDQDSFDEFIKKTIPKAFLYRFNPSETVYCLPEKITNDLKTFSDNFQTTNVVTSNDHLSIFFDKLDQEKTVLGVVSYGVSITTMDDVFLKVTADDQLITQETKQDNIDYQSETSVKISNTAFLKLTGFKLYFQQVKGLFLKRFHYAKRHWQLVLLQVVIPSFVLFMAFFFLNSITDNLFQNKNKLINITLSNFPKRIFYVGETYSKLFEEIVKNDGGEVKLYKKIEDVIMNNFDFGIKENKVPSFNFEDYTFWATLADSYSISLLINSFQNTFYKAWNSKNSSISVNKLTPELPLSSFLLLPKINGLIMKFFFPISLSLIASSFVLFPFHENCIKSKLVQKLTGVSSSIFWLSSFLFDIFYFSLVILFLLLIIVFKDNIGAISNHFLSIVFSFILLFCFGYSIIPLNYLLSFLPFKSPNSFFVVIFLTNMTLGIFFFIISEIAKFFGTFISFSYENLVRTLELFPIFTVANGLVKLYKFGSIYSICPQINCTDKAINMLLISDHLEICCKNDTRFEPNYFNWSVDKGIFTEIFIMFLMGTVSISFIIAIESNFVFLLYKIKNMFKKYHWLPTKETWDLIEDEDVKREKEYVNELIKNQVFTKEALLVHELFKKYKNLLAVNNLSFSLHHQECFGLLGINGAGKSTTFRMLTGDLIITYGNAYINGQNVKMQLKQFQKYISYCPQFDALLENLTPNETLYLFARLRGVPEIYIDENVNYLIEMLDLKKNANYQVRVLSGGNKRKLSLAIALIASPAVVFLDEPTTGVDPSSRRKVWSVLQHFQKENCCSIVLCSHSMEECEALCSRVGIMVKGQFKCLGPIQRLKDKYGKGYSIVLKLSDKIFSSELTKLKNYIENNFKNTTLTGSHGNTLCYHVNNLELPWSKRFHLMELAKTQNMIQDFIISDTSLEQIFLSFAQA